MGGGGSNPIEDAINTATDIVDTAGREIIQNPLETVSGDKQRKAEKKAKEKKKQVEKLQQEKIKEAADREAAEKLKEDAIKNRDRARARQKRGSSKGFAGTILTDSLGGAGGDAQDKKNLLGL
jgi:hypothetical protein